MRIGILSDTHDKRKRTGVAVRRLKAEGAEVLIHCGDLTGPDIVYECAGVSLPCYFVFGNNDFDQNELRQAMNDVKAHCLDYEGEILFSGRRIAVTHGDVGSSVRRLLQDQPDYLLTGHTHLAADSREGQTRWINPGALHRAETWTVAVLDLSLDQLHLIPIGDSR